MNKYLSQLVELCEFDKQLDGFKPKIEAAQEKLSKKSGEISGAKEQIETLNAEIAELKSQILQANAQLSAFSSKLKSTGKKSSAAKTEKEIKALSVEEDIAKEQLEATNEEIERLEKIVAAKEALVKEQSEKQEAFEAELKSLQEQVSAEMGEVEVARGAIYAKRDKLMQAMNPKTVSFYEKIRKWAGNTAVSPVRKQACYGCFMRISDKTYSAVIKSDDIVTCPYCGRILYKEAE